MPAASFPCHIAAQIDDGSEVQEYAVSTTGGETAAKAGELMFFDTATQTIKRCGANPALILGIFEAGDSSVARLLTPDNKVPVRILKPNSLVRMGSSATPADTHLYNATGYDLSRDGSGNWIVNVASTANPRVMPVRIDAATGSFYVKFLATNLQGDAIAS